MVQHIRTGNVGVVAGVALGTRHNSRAINGSRYIAGIMLGTGCTIVKNSSVTVPGVALVVWWTSLVDIRGTRAGVAIFTGIELGKRRNILRIKRDAASGLRPDRGRNVHGNKCGTVVGVVLGRVLNIFRNKCGAAGEKC